MRRRTFLTGLGWTAAGLALGACGNDDGAATTASSSTTTTTGLLDGVSFDVHRDPG